VVVIAFGREAGWVGSHGRRRLEFRLSRFLHICANSFSVHTGVPIVRGIFKGNSTGVTMTDSRRVMSVIAGTARHFSASPCPVPEAGTPAAGTCHDFD